MKEINWAMVLSFLVPGAGQIGRMRLSAGYFWFIVFCVSIWLGIYYSYFWFIATFIIHVLNVLDAGELLGHINP